MSYTWLIFDADNTLFDYDAAEGIALEQSFQQMGINYLPTYRSVYQQINSAIWHDFEQGKISAQRLRSARFERLFDELSQSVDATQFSANYLQNLGNCTDLIPGAAEIVRTLQKSHQMLIITNGLKDVQRSRLRQSVLKDSFADIIISDEIGMAKPHPEIFDVAFERMGMPEKNKVLMIGDSLTSDMQGGFAYGIDTCWFNPQQRPLPTTPQITYTISQLSDLLPIVNI